MSICISAYQTCGFLVIIRIHRLTSKIIVCNNFLTYPDSEQILRMYSIITWYITSVFSAMVKSSSHDIES